MRSRRISLKDSIRKRARNRCEKCLVKLRRIRGQPHNASFHHRRPRRIKGPNSITNEVLLCLDCHRAIHMNEPLAANTGWIVWGDPDFCPLRLSDGRWVLLVPDGSYEDIPEAEGLLLVTFVNGLDLYASPLTE